jgi:hypothetical protein
MMSRTQKGLGISKDLIKSVQNNILKNKSRNVIERDRAAVS